MNDSGSLRIVHCFRSPVGGIFRHVRDLATAQEKAGHAVGIVCDSTTGGDYEYRQIEALAPQLTLGVQRVAMQRHVGAGDFAAAWRSWKVIKGLRPDVLHGHGAKGGFYARAFGTVLRVGRSRVARLYSPHGGSLHYDSDKLSGRLFFLIERILETQTDRLVFVADYERRVFSQKIGGPHAPFSVIHNGLKPEEFEPVALAPDAADFLYIGMMRDLKGPDLFIDALAEARVASGRPLTAVMAGDGDDLPRYREQAATLGLADAISFRPPMPARDAFALARTVVVPSRAEALPYIVIEALGAGRPVIATRVGGIPEILGEDSPALTAMSARALAGRMVEAATDPEGFSRYMPALAETMAEFGVARMAERMNEAYRAARGGA